MDLSIAIVSWNTRELLDDCLRSVFENANDIELEVIVVDNASSDGSAEMVREKYPQVKVIENDENVGFAGANNQAYEVSSGRHFMILNPDTKVLSPLAPIVQFLDSNADVGAAGCKCVNPDMSIQRNWYDYYPSALWEMLPHRVRELGQSLIFRRDADSLFDTKWVGGQCMTVKREVLESVGGMDPDYFMYSEETDWCFRIRRAGWRVCHFPKIVILHYGGQSTKLAEVRMLVELQRSKYRFIARNLSVEKARMFKAAIWVKTLLQRAGLRLVGNAREGCARYAALTELQKSIGGW